MIIFAHLLVIDTYNQNNLEGADKAQIENPWPEGAEWTKANILVCFKKNRIFDYIDLKFVKKKYSKCEFNLPYNLF